MSSWRWEHPVLTLAAKLLYYRTTAMFLPQRFVLFNFFFFFHERLFPFPLTKTALPVFLGHMSDSSSHRYIRPVNDLLPQQALKAFLPLLPHTLGWLRLCGSQADLTAACFPLHPTHIPALCSTVQQPADCHTTHQTISVLTQLKKKKKSFLSLMAQCFAVLA